MRDQDLIKRFEYLEKDRAHLTFSDTTEIFLESNIRNQSVQLRKDSDGDYPITGEQTVRHRVTEPRALVNWKGFDYEADLPTGTSLGFRLSDGSSDFWWDGGAWSTPAAGEWNTVQEINDNVPTFAAGLPAGDRKKLQVVTRLVTTDVTLTPRLRATKLLYQARINFTEDLLLRSLIPTLKTQLGVYKDTSFKLASATAELLVGQGAAYSVRPYRANGVVGVWDEDNDPDHEVNLFQSWDQGTEKIALTGVVASGTRVFITFTYAPFVAMATHPDYYEVDSIPAVVVQGLRTAGRMRGSPAKRDAVIDRAAKTAKVVSEVDSTTFDVDLLVITDRNTDRMRLADAVRRLFDESPLLTLAGVDEETPTRVMSDPAATGQPDRSGKLMETLTVRFDRVHYFPPAEDRYVVTNFDPSLTAVQQ